MDSFATANQVELIWGSLSGDQVSAVDAKLAQASRIIRHQFSTIDSRIEAGSLDAGMVADIAVDMVIRWLRNPEGLRQESIQDYSYQRDETVAAGAISLTADEIALLTPAARRSKAFSIATGRETATCVQAEAAALHQRMWRQ